MTNESGIFYDVMIWQHKLADVIFRITQKPLYITASNLFRQYVTNKGSFLNRFIT